MRAVLPILLEPRGAEREHAAIDVITTKLVWRPSPQPVHRMHTAIFTGLRVSELIGLKWDDIHENSITIDERYCRGDWDEPKSEASKATIPVNRSVIERIIGSGS